MNARTQRRLAHRGSAAMRLWSRVDVAEASIAARLLPAIARHSWISLKGRLGG